MIQEWLRRIKGFTSGEWGVILTIVLVGALSFGLGRLSVIYGEEHRVEILYPENQEGEVLGASSGDLSPQTSTLAPPEGGYVASKTGSKYHLPWCAGARTIKPENLIHFQSKAEAEARGYEPAGNCKGI